MFLTIVPNLKEIHLGDCWLKVIVLNWCEEEEEENMKKIWQLFRNISRKLLSRLTSNLVCKVMYMEGIKYDRYQSSSYI